MLDLLFGVGVAHQRARLERAPPPRPGPAIERDCAGVLDLVGSGSATVDRLAADARVAPRDAAVALARLEHARLRRRRHGNGTYSPTGLRPAEQPPSASRFSIAGSDSGGGAGIQADLKAFARCRVHGMTAITALTAQNTVGVQSVAPVAPEMIVAQVEAVASDIGVDAVKVGMLADEATIDAVVEGPRPGRGRAGDGLR